MVVHAEPEGAIPFPDAQGLFSPASAELHVWLLPGGAANGIRQAMAEHLPGKHMMLHVYS